MRFRLSPIVLLAMSGASLAAFARAAPTEAEYAVHWDTSDGGPSTADEVIRLLGLGSAREDSFEVRYFDAPTPASAPDSARTILRQRSRDGSESELVVKYRRATPISGKWTCPLSRGSDRSEQVDIAFGSGGAVTRIYSYSCEQSADSFPPSLQASPRECSVIFTRLTAGEYKIETWPLPSGHRLLELSHVGRDSKKELAKFRELVGRLLAAGARPLSASKTELEGSCW